MRESPCEIGVLCTSIVGSRSAVPFEGLCLINVNVFALVFMKRWSCEHLRACPSCAAYRVRCPCESARDSRGLHPCHCGSGFLSGEFLSPPSGALRSAHVLESQSLPLCVKRQVWVHRMDLFESEVLTLIDKFIGHDSNSSKVLTPSLNFFLPNRSGLKSVFFA